MTKKVMIIDDDKQLLEELATSLRMDDYEVIPLDDPKKVKETAIAINPDVLLVDINMPGESGFEVAYDILYFSGLEDTAIIAMTGDFKERYLVLNESYGFKGFLKKPFDYVDLLGCIKAVQ
jgi:DNA-binding response OmpR family regulator